VRCARARSDGARPSEHADGDQREADGRSAADEPAVNELHGSVLSKQ
jgi:hypothetical protein